MPQKFLIKPALTLDLGNGIEMTFQAIPAGRFIMGSRGEYQHEEPPHWVRITRPFYLGTFPVTQQQFACWKPEHENSFPNKPNHPAENMVWHEANQFCQWLEKICANYLPSGHAVGLPTEAQWEYACRAGSDTEYYTGDGEAALAESGWYEGNADGQTQPVGFLEENDFGLFDMHGNVDEWCADAWDDHAYKKRVSKVCDPMVNGAEDAIRVIRGGCWDDSPWYCRTAFRGRWRPVNRSRYQGFRVCLFFGPVPNQQTGTGVTSEPVSVDVARRQAAAESEDAGGDVT